MLDQQQTSFTLAFDASLFLGGIFSGICLWEICTTANSLVWAAVWASALGTAIIRTIVLRSRLGFWAIAGAGTMAGATLLTAAIISATMWFVIQGLPRVLAEVEYGGTTLSGIAIIVGSGALAGALAWWGAGGATKARNLAVVGILVLIMPLAANIFKVLVQVITRGAGVLVLIGASTAILAVAKRWSSIKNVMMASSIAFASLLGASLAFNLLFTELDIQQSIAISAIHLLQLVFIADRMHNAEIMSLYGRGIGIRSSILLLGIVSGFCTALALSRLL